MLNFYELTYLDCFIFLPVCAVARFNYAYDLFISSQQIKIHKISFQLDANNIKQPINIGKLNVVIII